MKFRRTFQVTYTKGMMLKVEAVYEFAGAGSGTGATVFDFDFI